MPGYDSVYRPGDNLFTNSAIAFNVANGKMEWYFQYTPNDNRDYDETGTHILIDTKVNGEDRKIVTHPGRNGFNYTFDRLNGQFLKAGQYVGKVTWTKGIDPKTGKPVDYDPTKDLQIYAEPANVMDDKVTRRVCPDQSGGNNFWPASYSPKTKMLYIPSVEGCSDITPDHSAHVKGKFARRQLRQSGAAHQQHRRWSIRPPASRRSARSCPIRTRPACSPPRAASWSPRCSTAPSSRFDDQTLEELWKINVGTGFNAPPMTYSVDGKQYIAIASGLWRNAKNKLSRSPEMKTHSQATMIFVFGLYAYRGSMTRPRHRPFVKRFLGAQAPMP